MSRLVILDNEAVQALADPAHPKHSRVLSHVQLVAKRKGRAVPISLGVPTAVRVEAGWDRTASHWAFVNRLPVADIPLDVAHTNAAAMIRNRTGISVADAHIGAAAQAVPHENITVLTSDPGDMRQAAGDRDITIVVI
jgi:predicted nucleic acid-binding protein